MTPRAAELRRKLLANGLTKQPTCAMCSKPAAPRSLDGDGVCKVCAAMHREALDYMERMSAEMNPDGTPRHELNQGGATYTEGLEVDE